MIEPLLLLRALHYATTLLVTGALGFELLVAPGVVARYRPALVVVALAALLSALGWLVGEARSISGGTLGEAVSPALLWQVLRLTEFGHVWSLRLVLLALWPIALAMARGTPGGAINLLLGLAATALIAFAGHAAAAGLAQQISDMLHLVLAALWLGGLLPMAAVMARAARTPSPEAMRGAHDASRRFSPLGILCVGGLLATGLVNAWTLVGTIPGLVGTPYGRLLLFKLAAFIAMIGLAAVNRQRLTPALAGSGAGGAAQRLARNALLEAVLGIFILIDVGALGISVPAAHDRALWPLPVTWSLAATAGSATRTALAVAAVVAGIAGLAALLGGAVAATHRRRWLGVGGVLIALGIAAAGVAFREDAVPTLYGASPLPYSVATVAAGARIYAENCIACHGARGYGDGPVAASLPEKPADLAHQHIGHHPDGLLFWWIANGKPDTAMPAFGQTLDDEACWQALAFLHANFDAETGRRLGPGIDPSLRIPAPDFAFERGDSGQRTLDMLRGSWAVLLVLYTLPESEARLAALAREAQKLDLGGLRIVAVPLGERSGTGPIFATANPDLVAAYTLYSRGLNKAEPPAAHMEFLIDRWGYLRSRWGPDQGADPQRLATLLNQLDREPPPPPPVHTGHVH